MYRNRVIPVLLLSDGGLVKTKKFHNPKYVGDPVNAVKIFNEKEVDELIVVDINCSKLGVEPNYALIGEIAAECFMPVCYGGGISTVEQANKVFACGIEKIAINSNLNNVHLIRELSSIYGSQSIVASIDCKKSFFSGYSVLGKSGTLDFKITPVEMAMRCEELGAGEVLLNSIDNDGVMQGFDLKLIAEVSKCVDIPVVACGGAGSLTDLKNAIQNGASGVAAGSMFVFHGKHNAVLINYPSPTELALALGAQ